MDGKPRRRVPLSLEELKHKRIESEAAASKCVYVPRQRRLREESGNSSGKNHVEPPCSADKERSFQALERNSKRPRAASSSETKGLSESAEMAAIRKHYMVEDRDASARTVTRQQHDKTRFHFDWDADEDTNVDAEDSLYSVLRKKSYCDMATTQHRRQAARSNGGMPFNRDGDGETFDPDEQGITSRVEKMQAKKKASGSRHWSAKRRSEMSERDWAIFREDHHISVRGGTSESAKPARSWDETGLPESILHLVRSVARYKSPSPIQMSAIPVGLRKSDLIGLAETGSGKTAAFVLPMIVHIQSMPRLTAEIAVLGPYALVLAPTRELVLQIESETRKFADPLGYKVMAVIGGQGLEEQGLALQSGCEIVVCTPGRMVDLLSRRLAALANCNYLILDEADRMIDMGFEPQVQEILSAMPGGGGFDQDVEDVQKKRLEKREPKQRQTFMFSATMSPAVERLAREYLLRPTIVTIGETGKAAEAVDQRVEFISSEGKKRDRLVTLVSSLDPPIIVFVNTKKGCEDIARLIEGGCGLRPLILHSGKTQDQRGESLEAFKSGRAGVLVATDVLGRGIDIKGVNHVINFELPKSIAPYTHRIGRTGRAGHRGIAWSLATAADSDLFGELRAYLEQSGARVCPAIARSSGGRSDLRPIVD